MWKPATSITWQNDALCGKPKNRKTLPLFFSSEALDKDEAKNLCFQCPVRKDCLQWALEHKQIWGVWGGKDQVEIRRALSVSYLGEETKKRRSPNCPYCNARPNKLEVSIVQLEGAGRWTTAKVVTCSTCGFAWKSRTSANAVTAYKTERREKEEKREQEREKNKLKKIKKFNNIRRTNP